MIKIFHNNRSFEECPVAMPFHNDFVVCIRRDGEKVFGFAHEFSWRKMADGEHHYDILKWRHGTDSETTGYTLGRL